MVEKWLIDLIEAVYWLYPFWRKKVQFRPLKVLSWGVDGLESYPIRSKISFGSHPIG